VTTARTVKPKKKMPVWHATIKNSKDISNIISHLAFAILASMKKLIIPFVKVTLAYFLSRLACDKRCYECIVKNNRCINCDHSKNRIYDELN